MLPVPHRRAMQEADAADALIAEGRIFDAAARYARAAKLEEEALDSFSPDQFPRTFGVLAVSAAALWFEAGEYGRAIDVASRALDSRRLDITHEAQLLELRDIARSATSTLRRDDSYRFSRAFYDDTALHKHVPLLQLDVERVDDIYAAYGHPLQQYIGHFGIPEDEASDIRLATVAQYIKDRDRYSGAMQPLRALMGIARGESINYLRRQERFQKVLRPLPVITVDPTTTIEARVTATELLNALAEPCRGLLTKYFLEDATMAALASQLSISVDAARHRVDRCLKHARKVLIQSGRRK